MKDALSSEIYGWLVGVNFFIYYLETYRFLSSGWGQTFLSRFHATYGFEVQSMGLGHGVM